MQVVYSQFDGLDASYRGHISAAFMEALDEAQQRAIQSRAPVLLEFAGVKLQVKEHGALGGYAFTCDSGEIGATWFFKRPHPRDPSGIRVSCKSLTLATYGLDGTRKYIEATLHALGCVLHRQPESIGRVDFAVDVLAPGFELRPENFVMHARTTRADYAETGVRRSHGRSDRHTSSTVGKMPNRQVTIYDKRQEAIQKPDKAVWFDIWRTSMAERGISPVDFADPYLSAVWRIEVRIAKSCLKNTYKVTAWADLADKIRDIFLDTLERSRYVVPTPDSNRSRWPEHPLWALVRAEIAKIDIMQPGPLDYARTLDICRAAKLDVIDRQLVGLAATRIALASGNTMPSDPFQLAAQPIKRAISSTDGNFGKRLDKARERYANLT